MKYQADKTMLCMCFLSGSGSPVPQIEDYG